MFKVLGLVVNCSRAKRSFVDCKDVLMSSLHVTSCAIVERVVILHDSIMISNHYIVSLFYDMHIYVIVHIYITMHICMY